MENDGEEHQAGCCERAYRVGCAAPTSHRFGPPWFGGLALGTGVETTLAFVGHHFRPGTLTPSFYHVIGVYVA